MEYIYCIINVTLYASLFFYVYRISNHTKQTKHICLICLVWFICSIFAVLYVDSPIRYQSTHQTSMLPFIYLFVVFTISVYPLISNSSKFVFGIDDTPFINYLSTFIALIAYIPFVENVINLISVGGDGFDSLGDMYEVRLEDTFDSRAHMSWIGARFQSLLSFFTYISPILLFNHICSTKRKSIVAIGLFLASINVCVTSLAQGERGPTFSILLYLTFCYLLYEEKLSKKTRTVIKYMSYVMGISTAYLIMSITIGRFSESDYFITDWIFRYLGESFIDFNNDLFHISDYTEGRQCFKFLYDEIDTGRYAKEAITGIRCFVFYTYVGDVYMDFGPYITAVIFVVLSYLMKLLICKRHKMNLGIIIIYCLYSAMILLSTNCLFYRATSVYGALVALCFGVVYSFIRNNTNGINGKV